MWGSVTMSAVTWGILRHWADRCAQRRIEDLDRRIQALEEALRLYGAHLQRCALAHLEISEQLRPSRPSWHEGDYDAGCTCNLALTLTPQRAGTDSLGSIG